MERVSFCHVSLPSLVLDPEKLCLLHHHCGFRPNQARLAPSNLRQLLHQELFQPADRLHTSAEGCKQIEVVGFRLLENFSPQNYLGKNSVLDCVVARPLFASASPRTGRSAQRDLHRLGLLLPNSCRLVFLAGFMLPYGGSGHCSLPIFSPRLATERYL